MNKDRHKPSFCICGQLKDRRAIQCRNCRDKEPTEKTCTGCSTSFPIESYALRPNGRGGFKRRSRCRNCESTYARVHRGKDRKRHNAIKKKYYDKNPIAIKEQGLRAAFRKIGFDPLIGVKIYNGHSKVCDICGTRNKNGRALAIDHCHTTGKFRGFLCAHCNRGLGQFKDNIQTLLAAINYLQLTPLVKEQTVRN